MKLITLLHEKKFLRISVFEWLTIAIVFSLIFILLVKVAGGPTTSDEFFYMNLSINGIKSYLVLNYYFHIYLQRLFLLLAPSALAGAKYFWTFLITTSSFLIYLCARWLGKGKSIFNAILSVFIFFSISAFAQFSGTPKVDFTSLWVVAIIITVLIFYHEFNINKRIVLIILGFLFFLALKSKETTLISGVVLLGFGFDTNLKFTLREMLKSLLSVLIGFVLGGLFFILLNWLCVKDPLFGIRPQDYLTYFNMTVGSNQFLLLNQNWISDFVIKIIPIPFLLYVWGGFNRLQKKEDTLYLLIWLYPLFLLIFLVIVMLLTSGYNVVPRNFFPALPIISIFASQVFTIEDSKSLRSVKWGFIFAGVGFVVAIVFQQFIQRISPITNWTFLDFSQNIIMPIVIVSFLMLLLFTRSNIKKALSLGVVLISLGLSSNLIENIKSIVIDRPVAYRVSLMFYPLSAFKKQIHFSPVTIFYFSPTLPAHLQMLARDKDEVFSMFNIYFKVNSKMANFIFPAQYNNDTGDYMITIDPITSISEMKYDEAIIADEDWQRLKAIQESFKNIESHYNFQYDDSKTILFLSRK
jgi:hypothetical protein